MITCDHFRNISKGQEDSVVSQEYYQRSKLENIVSSSLRISYPIYWRRDNDI